MASTNQGAHHPPHSQSHQYHQTYQPYWSYMQQPEPSVAGPGATATPNAPASPWAQLAGGFGTTQQHQPPAPAQPAAGWNYLGGGSAGAQQGGHVSAFQPAVPHAQQKGQAAQPSYFMPVQQAVPATAQQYQTDQQSILNSFTAAAPAFPDSQAVSVPANNPVASYFGASTTEMTVNPPVSQSTASVHQLPQVVPDVSHQPSNQIPVPQPAARVHSNVDSVGGWSWSGEDEDVMDPDQEPSSGGTTTGSSSQSESRDGTPWSQSEWSMSPMHSAPDVVNLSPPGPAHVITEDETLTVMAAPDLISPGPANDDSNMEEITLSPSSSEQQPSSAINSGLFGNVKAFGQRLAGALAADVQADNPDHQQFQSLAEADAPLSLAQVRARGVPEATSQDSVDNTSPRHLSLSEVHMYSYYEQEGASRRNERTEASGFVDPINNADIGANEAWENGNSMNGEIKQQASAQQSNNVDIMAPEPLQNVNWDAMNQELRDVAYDQDRSVIRHPSLSQENASSSSMLNQQQGLYDPVMMDRFQSSAPESQQLEQEEVSTVEIVEVVSGNQQQALDLLPEGQQGIGSIVGALDVGEGAEDIEDNDDHLSTRVNYDEMSMMGHKVSVAETLNTWQEWDDDADSAADQDDNNGDIDDGMDDGLNMALKNSSAAADCRPEADQVSPTTYSDNMPVEEEISTVEFEEDGWGNPGWGAEDDWAVQASGNPGDEIDESGYVGTSKHPVQKVSSMAVNYDESERNQTEDGLNASSEASQQERLLSSENCLGRELREEYNTDAGPSQQLTPQTANSLKTVQSAKWSTMSNFDENSVQGEGDVEITEPAAQKERLLSTDSDLGKELRDEYKMQEVAKAIVKTTVKPETEDDKWSTMSNIDDMSVQGEKDTASDDSPLQPKVPGALRLGVLEEERMHRQDTAKWAGASFPGQSVAATDIQLDSKIATTSTHVVSPAHQQQQPKDTNKLAPEKQSRTSLSSKGSEGNWSTASNFGSVSSFPGGMADEPPMVQAPDVTIKAASENAEVVTVVQKKVERLTMTATVTEEIRPQLTSSPIESSFNEADGQRMPSVEVVQLPEISQNLVERSAVHQIDQIPAVPVVSTITRDHHSQHPGPTSAETSRHHHHHHDQHHREDQRSARHEEPMGSTGGTKGRKEGREKSPRRHRGGGGPSVRQRWRHKQKEYKDVINRLEQERAVTPGKLDWTGNPSLHGKPHMLVIASGTPPSAVSSSLQSSAQRSPNTGHAKKNHEHQPKTNSTPKTPGEASGEGLTPEVSVIERPPRRGIMTHANGREEEERRQPDRPSSVYSLDEDTDRRRRGRRRPSSRASESYGGREMEGRRRHDP